MQQLHKSRATKSHWQKLEENREAEIPRFRGKSASKNEPESRREGACFQLWHINC